MAYDFEKLLKERRKNETLAPADKYVPEMADVVLELMNEGKSIVQVSAVLRISRDTFYRWASDPAKPEFVNAVALGRTLAQAAHEQLLDDLVMGRVPEANKAAIVGQIYRMKCRFREDWMDRQESKIELTQSNAKRLTDQELEEQVTNLIKSQAIKKSG